MWVVDVPAGIGTGIGQTAQAAQGKAQAAAHPDEGAAAACAAAVAERDALRAENGRLWSALEREQTASAELRRLLGNAQQQLGAALPQLPPVDLPATRAQMPENTPVAGVRADGAPALAADAVLQAAKAAGLGKKGRRRLLERLFGR